MATPLPRPPSKLSRRCGWGVLVLEVWPLVAELALVDEALLLLFELLLLLLLLLLLFLCSMEFFLWQSMQ